MSAARSLHTGPSVSHAPHPSARPSGTLPSKAHTLSTSRSLNATRIDSRNGQTMANASRMTNGGNQYPQQPIPSQNLHPNHITDVFPDALTALTKTDEHTYSSSINPAANGGHAHEGHSHTTTMHALHNQSHHKLPLRMPVGPNLPTAQQQQGNLFDQQLNMTGMDDSVYTGPGGGGAMGNGSGGMGNANNSTMLNSSGIPLGNGPHPHLTASLQSDRVVPLQRENLRLVRSNNALQAHLVAEGERIEALEKNWAQELRQMKTKYNGMQFLHAQKTRKVANQETKLAELQQRLEAVLSDRAAYVKESIEVSSRLSPGPILVAPGFRPQDPAALRSNAEVDLMKQHETKLVELSAELAAVNARAAEWESERAGLLSKIATRDEEVKRLSDVLESERNWDKIAVEHTLKTQHKSLTKLQAQIDFLNEQRGGWERESQAFKEHGVSAHFVAQLNEARQQTGLAKQEAEQTMQRLTQLQSQLDQARDAQAKAEASKVGIDERIHARVTEAERAARAEIDHLRSEHSALQDKLAEGEQNLLDAQSRITSLEHSLHLMDHAASNKVSELGSKETLIAHQTDMISKLNAQMTELRGVCRALESQKSKVEAEWNLAKSELAQTNQALKDLRETSTSRAVGLQDKSQEVAQLREHVVQLQEDKHGLSMQLVSRDSRIQSLVNDVHNITQEKESMVSSLNRADEALGSLQGELTKVHASLEQKEQDYANLYEDYTGLTGQLHEMQKAKFPQLASQLSALKAENQSLQAQIKDLQTNTVGTLTAKESNMKAEIARLNSTQSELLQRIDASADKLSAAQEKITGLESEIYSLTHTTSTKTSQLESNNTLLQHHTDLISKLNLQITDLKQVLRSMDAQKTKIESEWSHARSEVDRARRELQAQMEIHTNQSLVLTSTKQENVELKSRVGELVDQTRRMEQELSARDQRLRDLGAEVQSKVQNSAHLESLVDEAGNQTSALQDALRSKEYELSNVSSQLSAAQARIQKLSEEAQLKSADLKAILSDLENILKENQMLTRELTTLKSSVEDRAADAERQQARALHAEELYRNKEGEALDLLANYRSVVVENERLKLASDELDQERSSARQTLKQAQEAQFQSSLTIQNLEGELRKRMLDVQSLESVVQELSRSLESQKKTIDALHQEKMQLGGQIDSARNVAGGLEHSRTEGLRLMAEYKSQLSKLQIDLQSSGMDNAHLTHTLTQAREHSANLEKIIASLRQSALQAESLHAQQSSDKNHKLSQVQQELQSTKITVDTLNEQIASLNAYREKQNKEINRLLSTLASAPSSVGSSSVGLKSADFLSQLSSLQGVVDTQFSRIQSLQQEKSKLKGYIVKYETELARMEQAQRRQGGQGSNVGASAAPTPAAASSSVAAVDAANHSSLLSPGQPSPPQSANSQQQPTQSSSSSSSFVQQSLMSSFHVQRA